ncbi:MAG: DUF4276 family protein, partial [Chloroflexota bacterium]
WSVDEVDLVILLVDADEEINKRQRQIDKAMEAVCQNHLDKNDQLISDQNAGGLAIQTFDTWLLADTGQVINVLKIDNLPDLPDNLESLSTTKTILEDSIEQSTSFLPDEEKAGLRSLKARWALAFVADLAKIKERCPQGYKTFADRLKSAAKIASQSF